MSLSQWLEYAPITTRVGFIESPVEVVLAQWLGWQALGEKVIDEVDTQEHLPDALRLLQPLIQQAHPRRLFVKIGDWTAFFDCGALGGGPPVRYLAGAMNCRGVEAVYQPHTYDTREKRGLLGSTQWTLYGPEGDSRSHIVRTVAASFDTRWVFFTEGRVQPYEEPGAYEARVKRDRFTPQMLESYCRALGIDIFNFGAYGPRGVLTASSERISPTARFMTLHEARVMQGRE